MREYHKNNNTSHTRGERERERERERGGSETHVVEREVGQKHTSCSGKIHVPTWMI